MEQKMLTLMPMNDNKPQTCQNAFGLALAKPHVVGKQMQLGCRHSSVDSFVPSILPPRV